MRLMMFASMLALAAMPCLAADTGDAGAAPLLDDPAVPAPAPAPPEAAPAEAPKAGKSKVGHVVWAMPGHATFAIGCVVETTEGNVDVLRGRGLARPADPTEVKAAKEAGRIHKLA